MDGYFGSLDVDDTPQAVVVSLRNASGRPMDIRIVAASVDVHAVRCDDLPEEVVRHLRSSGQVHAHRQSSQVASSSIGSLCEWVAADVDVSES